MTSSTTTIYLPCQSKSAVSCYFAYNHFSRLFSEVTVIYITHLGLYRFLIYFILLQSSRVHQLLSVTVMKNYQVALPVHFTIHGTGGK